MDIPQITKNLFRKQSTCSAAAPQCPAPGDLVRILSAAQPTRARPARDRDEASTSLAETPGHLSRKGHRLPHGAKSNGFLIAEVAWELRDARAARETPPPVHNIHAIQQAPVDPFDVWLASHLAETTINPVRQMPQLLTRIDVLSIFVDHIHHNYPALDVDKDRLK